MELLKPIKGSLTKLVKGQIKGIKLEGDDIFDNNGNKIGRIVERVPMEDLFIGEIDMKSFMQTQIGAAV